jgi:hypothetical protein
MKEEFEDTKGVIRIRNITNTFVFQIYMDFKLFISSNISAHKLFRAFDGLRLIIWKLSAHM